MNAFFIIKQSTFLIFIKSEILLTILGTVHTSNNTTLLVSFKTNENHKLHVYNLLYNLKPLRQIYL